VGANIFVGNLSDNVDEKMLRDVFISFGIVLATKIMRDPETTTSKNYGFVSFDNFDSSDVAIRHMQGQYVEGKPIDVSYAYKKDSHGDKHGSLAERKLAYSQGLLIQDQEMTGGGKEKEEETPIAHNNLFGN